VRFDAVGERLEARRPAAPVKGATDERHRSPIA
jgi:hypothetical protein